jgi:PEP-CTERM motif
MKSITWTGKWVATGALLLGAFANAHALEMYGFTGVGTLSGPTDFAQATHVQTNQSVVIDQIGIWDMNGDGLAQNHGFRIRDLTNNVDLYNGIVLAGSGTLINGFRYIDIANISVATGVQLAVMSDNRSGDNGPDLMGFNLSGLSFDPAMTLLGSSYQNGTDVSTFPFDTNFGNNVIAGANLILQVPEPAMLALFAAGLGGLGFSRRRKV